jgi:outer membrane scaffolding protein for murein synthesis (MipA/OmpV family)
MAESPSLFRWLSTLLLLCGLPGFSEAGSLLDALREYDLNDNALGIGMSASGNPYADASGSEFLYPYVTSLQDPTLTHDWLTINGTEVGVRRANPESSWELGVVGRLQTLGFGSDPGSALAGLDPPGWTLETGPMLGWRGGPIQVQLKHYWEILGRHSGTSQELRFAFPSESSDGYLVPFLSLRRQSGRYTNHYFGVREQDSTAQRDPYVPGTALNLYLGLRWGYRLNRNWLLSGSMGLEYLDDAVTDSPIVDDKPVGSVSLGLAYNKALFRPYQAPEGAREPTRWELSLAYIDARIDSTQRFDASSRQSGTAVDLEDMLGLSDRDELITGQLTWRFSHYHRLEFEYLQIDRQASFTTPQPIPLGDTVVPDEALVNTSTLLRLPSVSYGFSFIRDSQKELGITVGIHMPESTTRVEAQDEQISLSANTATPLPVLGVFGSASLRWNLFAKARVQVFRLDVDRYDGSMTLAEARIGRTFGRHADLSLGWVFYRLNLRVADDDFRGRLKVDYQGPQITIGLKL